MRCNSISIDLAVLFCSCIFFTPNKVYLKYSWEWGTFLKYCSSLVNYLENWLDVMTDIWMIVTFMYPFIIIFLHSVLYVLIKKNRQSGISKQDKVVGMLQLFSRVILPGTFLVFLVSYWTFALLHMNARRILTEGIFDNISVW